MVPALLKRLLIPGTPVFLILALVPGVMLLYRRKDGGRAGRIWITALVAGYLLLSLPITAVALIRALTPSYPPVMRVEDARGATAVVVLGAGMHTYHSRGDMYAGSNREYALRIMEAVRVFRILGRPWIIISGALGNERETEAHHMAVELRSFGIDPSRILVEEQATNTRDHTIFVPPMLKAHGVEQFVVVTSRKHMARALRAFRKAGWNPVPSSPEFFVYNDAVDRFLPSMAALDASSALLYDELAMVYYWARGWI
jgi:uncharacterized SAM-binding protein YcdF (DUF218 family)